MNLKLYITDKLQKISRYITSISKWLILSIITGIICGLSGVVFHYSVETATTLREKYPFLLFALPVAGLIIVFLYHICKMEHDKGTNTVIKSIRSSEKIPILMAPLILIATTLTHLCGGSSGREGAALQIGGSIGSFLGGIIHLDEKDMHVMTMCGMSALFSAVFGTPLTAAIFSMEVISVGIIYYNAFFPCLLSAIAAHSIAEFFSVPSASFLLPSVPQISPISLIQVIVMAGLGAILSVIFIVSMHKFSHFFSRIISNDYIRAIVGGITVIILTLLFGTRDYNGVGMSIIRNAIENGSAAPTAFIFKMILTVVTLSSGFKGGEIVPTFFIGSTFGVLVSDIIGLDPSFAAAVGLVAMFCGVVNCPLASVVLSVELFGSEGIIFFALSAAVSYIMSGYYGLYSSQKIMYSKLQSTYINKDAK
jgi:H+/Cl- antiporter ClcA